MKPSMNMIARQHARKDGKYSKMNKCEFCNKAIGDGYSTLSNFGETGIGLVVCEPCLDKHDPLSPNYIEAK